MESPDSKLPERLYEPLSPPTEAPEIGKAAGRKTQRSPAERIYGELRGKIADVFPDNDEVAWSYRDETFAVQTIERPLDAYDDWFEKKFQGSDDFSKLFTRRLFLVWEELKEEQYVVNGDQLWEHQKALFAWAALNICTGMREEMANLLLRSPYGSGKSKVTGLMIRAFRDAQLDLMLLQGKDHKEIPTGALIGKRKEHLIQNAVGEQYAVLDSEHLERAEMNRHWKDLAAMYGSLFTDLFPQPKKASDPFYAIFESEFEDGSSAGSIDARLSAYLKATGRTIGKRTKPVSDMLSAFKQLIDGEIVLILNEENIPVPVPAQLRDDCTESDVRTGLTGDSAFALREGEHYRIKASDRHLSPDRSTHTTKVNADDPAQFAIVHGTALTRNPETIRRDIRGEIAERCKGLFLDEAGLLNPAVIGDSVTQLVSHEPIVIGVTGQDKGVAGWQRSPSISEAKMIELGLMKPVSYAGIGDPENPPSAGSEEAWQAYEEAMFEDYQTAEILGISQPHEVDTVVVLKAARVHEYAKRIRLAHEARNVPVNVFIYSTGAGNRKTEVLKAFKAPKKKNEPRRILVAEDKLIAESLTIPNAQCYDILDVVSDFDMDQIRGRLGHVRNTDIEQEQAVARTVIRQQFLHKGRDPYVRTAARKQGYALPDEDAAWRPLHSMIDRKSHDIDAARKELKKVKALSIPDAPVARRRKMSAKGSIPAFVGTELGYRNPHAKMLDDRKKEKERKKRESLLKARQQQERLEEKELEALLQVPASRPKFSEHASGSKPPVEFSSLGDIPWFRKHKSIYE